jgi:hypothetical protein
VTRLTAHRQGAIKAVETQKKNQNRAARRESLVDPVQSAVKNLLELKKLGNNGWRGRRWVVRVLVFLDRRRAK